MKYYTILLLSFLSAALFFSCAKTCECTEYDEFGEETGNVTERPLPRGYNLNCAENASDSTALDGAGGYICQ